MSLRRPRFKRATVASIQLTERDRDIIRQVHRHRFLRSSHIISLIGASRQQILRRLQLLYHRGYLERPRMQIEYFNMAGSQRMVYGLGDEAAAVLKCLGIAPHGGRYNEKNHAVGRFFLRHTLLVSDVMVAIELACRRNGKVRLLYGEDIAHSPLFRWKVTINRTKLNAIPDRVFALEAKEPRKDRACFFLEADRGTMPVTRKNLKQTSFRRKLLAYEATWNQNIHRSRFGFNRFRVLTVTTNVARIKSLVQTCSQLKTGHGLFLFADQSILEKPEEVLSATWRTGRIGEMTTLLE